MIYKDYFTLSFLFQDIPLGLLHDIHEIIKKIPERADEIDDVVTNNRIFIERTKGIGVATAHEALSRGYSLVKSVLFFCIHKFCFKNFRGAMLRCTGVKWDLRKTQPYDAYEELEFDVPVGKNGDIYDR